MRRTENKPVDPFHSKYLNSFPVEPAAEELTRFLSLARGWRITLENAGPFRCLSEALDLEVAPTKLVLTFSGSERVWSRRILDYEFIDELAVRLLLGRRGRGDPLTATIVADPGISSTVERKLSHRAFRHTFRRSILNSFRGAKLLRLRRRPTVPPPYAGLVMNWQGRTSAVIGLMPGAGYRAGEGLLTAGLLWYEKLCKGVEDVSDLFIIQLQARTSTTRRRLRHIRCGDLRIALFDMEPARDGRYAFRRVALPLAFTRPSGPERAAWPHAVSYRMSDLLLRVTQLAPSHIRRHSRPEGYDSLRLRGLEFARVAGRRREVITFGVGKQRQILSEATWPELEQLVLEILSLRQAGRPNPRHPFYARQPERWLESLIVDNIRALAPELDERFVYPQVPVCLDDRRGLADILTVDRNGRLVVIEIKADEDVHLPLQGLDYWSAVRWHHQRHEFQRRGYFPGLALSPQPPRLYLVAPLLRLHKAQRFLTSCLDPALEPVVIGINLDWRRRVKVLHRYP
ncbi:MAG: hypothetical protein HYR55_14240 [Acidobacteria bacterium]|nr:hypothetical protein [Acidobacteriota bacterium]MBI3658641.1 hypothetical protein [Acidobacteriota bacterium]